MVSLFGVGCGVGDDGKVEPNDPNPNGIICTDSFTLTGTFTPGTPVRDADSPTGCWPVGTWTFRAALDPTDDRIIDVTGDKKPDRCGTVAKTSAATFDPQYSFVVNRTMDPNGDDWVETYAVPNATPSGTHTAVGDKFLFKVQVTEGGALDCEGDLELFSQDGTMEWNLHPNQRDGLPLAGFGDFTLYSEPKN